MVLGSWNPGIHHLSSRARKWPFQTPITLRFKGKMANFEAKNTAKQGKNAKSTNGTQFTRVHPPPKKKTGEAFLLTVGAFLLTVKLLCLQSLKVLIRCTFSIVSTKAPIVSKEAKTVSEKAPTVSKKAKIVHCK